MQPLAVKKTPSALKWLAEKRARIAHQLEQAQRIAEEHAKRIESLELDLESLDRSIRLYDSNIDPGVIGPVNGWKGRYGNRGGLRETVLELLQERSPHWVPTEAIEVRVSTKFSISLPTPQARKRWYTNSLLRALRRLRDDELVEDTSDPEGRGSDARKWRLVDRANGTLSDLMRSAAAAGEGAFPT